MYSRGNSFTGLCGLFCDKVPKVNFGPGVQYRTRITILVRVAILGQGCDGPGLQWARVAMGQGYDGPGLQHWTRVAMSQGCDGPGLQYWARVAISQGCNIGPVLQWARVAMGQDCNIGPGLLDRAKGFKIWMGIVDSWLH